MNRSDIMDRVGADDWHMVADAFAGLAYGDVLAALNDMYAPGVATDSNEELAGAIVEELRADDFVR